MMALVALVLLGFPAALSADTNISRKEAGLQSYPVYQSTTIYKGGLVVLNSTGYLIEGTAAKNTRFAGVAAEGANNSSGSDGDLECRVYTAGTFLLPATSITQAMVGRLMYLADDATVDETADYSNIVVGRLVRYVSNTSGWVDIGQRGMTLDNAPGYLMRTMPTGYTDEMGAIDYGDLTLAGASGGHIYGRGSWINLASGCVPGAQHIHVPWEGGIYDEGATLTNARIIFGAQFQAILASNPAKLYVFRFNVAAAGGAVSAIIQCQAANSVGYAAGETGSGGQGTIPLVDIGDDVRYVNTYATSS